MSITTRSLVFMTSIGLFAAATVALPYVGRSGEGKSAPLPWYLDMMSPPGKPVVASNRSVLGIIDDQFQLDATSAVGFKDSYFGDGASDRMSVHHGTAMLSLIVGAARESTFNRQAVGIYPSAKIWGLSTFDGNSVSQHSVAEALHFAVEQKIEVILLAYDTAHVEPELLSEIQAAVRQGVVLVVGSGNGGAAAVNTLGELDGVVSVGAIDSNRQPLSFSGDSARVIFVAPSSTPGSPDQIWAADEAGEAFAISGTSVSAALVAGALIYLLDRHPNLRPVEAVKCTALSATDLGVPGGDSIYGFGLINLRAAETLATAGCR